MRVMLKTYKSNFIVAVEEGRLKGASKYGLSPRKWISTCGGDPHVRAWREAVIFGTDENKKKITKILRGFKGSKFKLYICGAEGGKKDIVIFVFHFDWKKDTENWYSIEFKDFSEILPTLQSKIKELRQKHDDKVKSENKKREEEEEMIKQEIVQARDFISLERGRGNDEVIAFYSKLKDLIMEIAKRGGVEIEQIDKVVNFLSLAYYYGYKDINKSRVTDTWIFLEALNQHGETKMVYMLFDFMRDVNCSLIDNYKRIISKD